MKNDQKAFFNRLWELQPSGLWSLKPLAKVGGIPPGLINPLGYVAAAGRGDGQRHTSKHRPGKAVGQNFLHEVLQLACSTAAAALQNQAAVYNRFDDVCLADSLPPG